MNSNDFETVGIIGAGKVGVVLAQLALAADYKVLIAGSGNPAKITLSMSVLAPGAKSLTTKEVAAQADVIILALPLGKYQNLPSEAFAGKLVLDATNYWWETDGVRDDLSQTVIPSSQLIQEHLKYARVVKAFNHTGYHELYDSAKQKNTPQRKAIAVAGDNTEDILKASKLINDFGFDAVYAGTIAESAKLQPHGNIFGTNPTKQELKALLSQS